MYISPSFFGDHCIRQKVARKQTNLSSSVRSPASGRLGACRRSRTCCLFSGRVVCSGQEKTAGRIPDRGWMSSHPATLVPSPGSRDVQSQLKWRLNGQLSNNEEPVQLSSFPEPPVAASRGSRRPVPLWGERTPRRRDPWKRRRTT